MLIESQGQTSSAICQANAIMTLLVPIKATFCNNICQMLPHYRCYLTLIHYNCKSELNFEHFVSIA